MNGKYLFYLFLILLFVGIFSKVLSKKVKQLQRRLLSDNVTKNFKWYEFDCHDEARTPVPEELRSNVVALCNELEVIREHFGGKPVIIASGYRTYEYNKKVGGAVESQHVLGKASDIRIKGVGIKALYTGILDLMNKKRIKAGGLAYSEAGNFVHYDIRGYFATWKYNK